MTFYYRTVFSIIWIAEHFLGKKIAWTLLGPLFRHARKYNLIKLQKLPKGRKIPIDIVDSIDTKTLRREYLAKNKPLIIRGGAKDWDCVKNWSPETFNEKYGEDMVPIIGAAPKDLETNEMDYSLREVKLSEVIAGMKAGNTELYSRFNDIISRHPELLNDINKEWMLANRELIASGKAWQCFMGPKGSFTHTHCAIQSNFFVQVYGKKGWVMYDPKYNPYLRPPVARRPYFHTLFDPKRPDFENFPEMQWADYYEFELEPGDIFFNPPSLWHYVHNPTISIGLGFRWTSLNAIKSSPIHFLLALFATDPSIIFAARARGNFSKVFSATKATTKA
jgi:hypothetical protein